MRNIFAYTPSGTLPPYISVNERGGEVEITVRSEVMFGGFTSTMKVPVPQLRAMAEAILKALPANVMDCPHATYPFRYCDGCKVSPCPIGIPGGRS